MVRALIPSSLLAASAAAAMTWADTGSAARTQQLAFVSVADIYVINADGTGQRQLTNQSSDGGPVWSPDGRRIAFVRTVSTPDGDFHDAVHVMNADGSGLRRLTETPSTSPVWSPDSGKIAFVGFRSGSDRAQARTSEIYVIDADGTHKRRLTRNRAFDGSPAWAPGRRIAFVRDRASDTRTGRAELYAFGRSGRRARRLTRNRKEDSDPEWSPEGKRLVFVRGDSESHSGKAEIDVMRVSRRRVRRLTSNRLDDLEPTWSPSGRRIAFTRIDRSDEERVLVMTARGRRRKRLASGAEPAWSVDGRLIAFTRSIEIPEERKLSTEIVLVSSNGGRKRQLTHTDAAAEPAWRP